MDHVYFQGIASPPRPRRHVVHRPVRTPHGMADTAAMDSFTVWLLHQAGLDPANYRGRCFARRLAACLRLLRVANPDAARALLEARPDLVPRALDTFLLGVTQFFRDAAVFDILARDVLPRLVQSPGKLRIWSAACSDGPELYSIAMLLADLNQLPRCELLGTDCRTSAIERAQSGLYAHDALRWVSAPHRRHFSTSGSLVRISSELRSAARWEVQDLFAGPAAGPWDLILWRNMSIYLTPEAALALWTRVAAELRPGGFFVAGKADHPPLELGWSRLAPCVYRKPECP